jgi:hypothetical protein
MESKLGTIPVPERDAHGNFAPHLLKVGDTVTITGVVAEVSGASGDRCVMLTESLNSRQGLTWISRPGIERLVVGHETD